MNLHDLYEMRDRRDAYQRDYDHSVSGMGRGDDHRGLRQELAHERNNIQIAINGRPWKVIAGRGTADSAEERSHLESMKQWAKRKSTSSGKKWTVYLTGAEVSEGQGVTEAEGPGRVDPILYKALARMTKGGYDDAKIALAIEFGLLDMKHNYAIANNYIPKLVDLYNQKQGVAEGNLKEFAPGSGGGESGRWYTDDQMTDLVGDGWWNDLDISGDISKQEMIQEAQAWLDDQGYSVHVLNCKVNDDDMEWYIEGSFHNPGFAKKGVAEGKADYNFDIEDLKRLERIRDLATMKAQALALISKPSAKPMKPEKVEWFKNALERMNSPMKVIKLMYDLLLSGEGHAVVGTRSSMNPNSYRQRFGEQGMAEGVLSFLKTEPEKKKWNPAKDSRVTGNKQDNEGWIKLLIDKHRRGVPLTDREWNSIEQWKLQRVMSGESTEIQELSTGKLALYKKAAGADAKKADASGNYARGDKRFKGINRATNKQFDNDLKKHGQQSVAEAEADSDGYSMDHADSGEYDYEGDQARDQMNTIVRAARRLDGLLDDNENMPEWVQMKVTLAADYLDTAADYIESNQEPELEEGEGGRGRPPTGQQDTTPVTPGRVEKTATGIRHHADASRYGGTEPDAEDNHLMSKSHISRLGKMTKPDIDEGEKVGNMDADAFDAGMARLKQLAGAGPLKTVYDPTKRVYRNVPVAVQPKK